MLVRVVHRAVVDVVADRTWLVVGGVVEIATGADGVVVVILEMEP